MTDKTYTYGQCYELLDVDAKTFRRWLERADFDASAQVSKADNRIKFLTEAQVMVLASDHARPWPPHPAAPADPESTTIKRSEYKLLDDKVNEQATDINELDDHWRGAMALIDKLEQRLKTAETTIADQADQIEEMERKAEAQASELEQIRSARRTGKGQAHVDGVPDLPEHLSDIATFADLHQIPTTTVMKAIQTFRIPAVRGKWHVGRSTIRVALDAAGRAAFHDAFHASKTFKPCGDCPHYELPAELQG